MLSLRIQWQRTWTILMVLILSTQIVMTIGGWRWNCVQLCLVSSRVVNRETNRCTLLFVARRRTLIGLSERWIDLGLGFRLNVWLMHRFIRPRDEGIWRHSFRAGRRSLTWFALDDDRIGIGVRILCGFCVNDSRLTRVGWIHGIVLVKHLVVCVLLVCVLLE